MATIIPYLSQRKNDSGESEIYLRITLSRDLRYRLRTGLTIKPSRFINGKVNVPRLETPEAKALNEIRKKLQSLENDIHDYVTYGDITKEGLQALLLKPKIKKTKIETPAQETKKRISKYYKQWTEFIENRDVSEHRKSEYRGLVRILKRYETWKSTEKKNFSLEQNELDPNEFIWFYRMEPKLYDLHPDLYKSRPKDRGDNTVSDIVKKLSSFYNWRIANKYAKTSPMKSYNGVRKERYGRPVYLSIEERDRLYAASMSPALSQQRDIFVFQCLVGCRVSDLYSFTRDNFTDGILQYIPGKTRKERLDVIRVPLSPTAKEILKKYEHLPNPLPLISQQKYNCAIKKACKAAGIDRVVTVINPTTGEDERKPLWQVVSSHTARRTFVGNLYKKLKDPNLIGALSGHKEGSKAFARYRDIDDDIRKEVVNLLE